MNFISFPNHAAIARQAPVPTPPLNPESGLMPFFGSMRSLVTLGCLVWLLSGCAQLDAGLDSVKAGYQKISEKVAETATEIGRGNLDKIEVYQWIIQPRPLQVGDYVVQDNPRQRWEVFQIIGRQIFWQSDDGSTKITDYNPILPAYEWRVDGKLRLRRLLYRFEGRLFPTANGVAARFSSTTNSSAPPFAFESVWTCAAVGQQESKPYRDGSLRNVILYECAQGAVVTSRLEYGLEEGRVIATEQLSGDISREEGNLQAMLASSRREEIEYGNAYGLPPIEPSVVKPGFDQKDNRFGRLDANPAGTFGPETLDPPGGNEDEQSASSNQGVF